MRLIDAEKCPCLVKCYSNRSEVRGCFEPCDELKEWFLTQIYDVDKVVEELEALNPVDYGSIYSYEGHSCAREMKRDAIYIVERGGIE